MGGRLAPGLSTVMNTTGVEQAFAVLFTPKRIQLRRTKGWRKPAGAVVVARPSRWGNPFHVGAEASVSCESDAGWMDGFPITITADLAVQLFRELWTVRLIRMSEHPDDIAMEDRWHADIEALRGHDLACWCPLDQPCHGDVLLELANGGGR